MEASKAANNKTAYEAFCNAKFAYRVKQNAELYGNAELDAANA